MEAKNTHYVNQQYLLNRYEQSITVKGHTIYFEQSVPDDAWYQIINALESLCATAYNDGVEDTRLSVKEALGIHGN